MKKILKEHKFEIILIIIFSIISMSPLIIENHRLCHDLEFHLVNSMLIEKYLGINISIIPEIFNNLGYGINLFYPVLPHLILAITYHFLKIFGITLLESLIIDNILITIISSLLIYKLTMLITKNKKISLLSTTIFIFFPYRICNFIVRCAFNEVLCYIFMPMILIGIYYLFNKKYNKFYIYFILGYLGLFSSHLVLSLYFTCFLIPLFILNYKKTFTKEVITKLLFAAFITTLITLPTFTNFLETRNFTDYYVYQDGAMSDITYMNYFNIQIRDLFRTDYEYHWDIVYNINIITIIGFIISIFLSFMNKEKDKNIIYMYIITIISFIMMLKNFPWDIVPKVFYMIQFPFRLFTIFGISFPIISSIFLKYITNNKIKNIILYIFIIIVILGTIPLLKNLSSTIYHVGDTYDVNKGAGHSNEYLPVKAYDNYYVNSRNQDIIITNGNGNIKIINNNMVNQSIEINITNSDNLTIEYPRLYYPGYRVKDSNGNKIKYHESTNGLIEVNIPSDGIYTLYYTGSNINIIAKTLSIITIITIGSYLIYNKKKA